MTNDFTPFIYVDRDVDKKEDFSQLYKYTVIFYRLALRKVIEFSYAFEVIDFMKSDDHSVGIVITPNGKAWKREDFIIKFNEITGEDNL